MRACLCGYVCGAQASAVQVVLAVGGFGLKYKHKSTKCTHAPSLAPPLAVPPVLQEVEQESVVYARTSHICVFVQGRFLWQQAKLWQ